MHTSLDVLASDAEREETVRRLNTAFADGRLDLDEHDSRVDAAYRSRTRAQLSTLVADLPRTDLPARSPEEAVRQPVGETALDVVLRCLFCCGFAGRRSRR